MKKRIIISTILLIIMTALSISISYATEINPINMEYTPIIEGDIATQAIGMNDNVKEDSIYKANEKIELCNEVVNGSVYLAGNDVIIKNETINGDVFIFSNNVEITSDAIINGNLFICASNVKLNTTICRDLFCVAKDIVFEEKNEVIYDANIAAEHIYVNGRFERNLRCSVSNMEVDKNAIIIGELSYSSEQEAKIEEKATIGNINFSKEIKAEKTVMDIVTDYIIDFTKYFLLTMVLLIVCIKIAPKFIDNLKNQFKINSFGTGILSLILIPIILVFLLLVRITTTLAFAMLALFILILILSMAITNIAVAKKIEEKKPSIKLPIWTTIVTIVTWIIYQMPVLGGIVAFIWVTTGLGMSIRSFFKKSK